MYRDKDPADYTERDTMPYFWARRVVNTPEEKALSFSHTFLGVRLECAQCHKHPFDQWTQDDFKQFTAFFAPIRNAIAPDGRARAQEMRKELGLDKLPGGQAQRELARLAREGTVVPWQEVFLLTPGANGRPQGQNGNNAQNKNAAGRVATPKLLGGDVVQVAAKEDPRKPLMEWIRSKDNPYFARAFINRVWAVDFGHGIIDPPDDMNLANPPGNAALLDSLAEGFIAHDFDMKWLHREIMLSQTYQRSWQANETNTLDEKNFSRAVVRRLPAEVVLDAVAQVTGSTEALAKCTTREALEERLIGPKGGAGLPRQGVGGGDYAARVFGRSTREINCDCAASNQPNLLQSIFLQNDNALLASIDRKGGWLDECSGNAARSALQARRNAQQGIADLEKRLAKLEESDVAQDAAVRGEEDIRDKDTSSEMSKLRERIAERKAKLDAMPNPAPPAPMAAEQVIREAFLRALNRRPTDAELSRALEHFKDASAKPKALRDLLWALLNTKEFTTNH